MCCTIVTIRGCLGVRIVSAVSAVDCTLYAEGVFSQLPEQSAVHTFQQQREKTLPQYAEKNKGGF